MHQLYLADPAVKTTEPGAPPPADIELRFKYNQDFDSIYAMVPSTMALMLGLFPAILMALGVVREKELGSITNLYVTPVTRIEFLIGKQIPYIAVAHDQFRVDVPDGAVRLSGPAERQLSALVLGVLLYVTAMTAYGMLISAFTNTQIAALFGTAILTVLPATQFSGMMTPVSSLGGGRAVRGAHVPDDLFRADQRRHLHQGPGLHRPRHEPRSARGLHPAADAHEPFPPAQTGTLGKHPAMRMIANIFWLGIKELRSFLSDYVLLGLVIYAFSLAVIMQARSNSQELHNASIAIVDEDNSELSRRIAHAFMPPLFPDA